MSTDADLPTYLPGDRVMNCRTDEVLFVASQTLTRVTTQCGKDLHKRSIYYSPTPEQITEFGDRHYRERHNIMEAEATNNPQSAPTWACCDPCALLILSLPRTAELTEEQQITLFNYGWLDEDTGQPKRDQANDELDRAKRAARTLKLLNEGTEEQGVDSE